MKFDAVKRLPLLLFTMYFLKVMFSIPSWIDSGLLMVLGGVAGFYEAWSERDLILKLYSKIKTLEEKHSEIEKGNQELKTYVTGLKLGQQMRVGTNVRQV